MAQTIENSNNDSSKIELDAADCDPALKKLNKNSIHLYLAIFSSCIGGLLFGFDTSIISGAMLLMKSEFNLTVFEQSIIVSAVYLLFFTFKNVFFNFKPR